MLLFFRFLQTIHTKANVKSSATFRKRICPLLFKNIDNAVTEIFFKYLPQTNGAAVTSDHWTSRAYDNFQSLTLHFIGDDFVLHKVYVHQICFMLSCLATECHALMFLVRFSCITDTNRYLLLVADSF